MFKRNLKRIIFGFLLVSLLMVSVPREAQARNLFSQFFRDLKRGTRFIVTLPDRITRPLGPVLGPIVSGILTQNIAGHQKFGQLFNNARRVNNAINSIEEQKRLTGEVRQTYRDQASELRKYAQELQAARDKLRKQLTDRDVSMSDYIKTAINIDKMIETVNASADRFDRSANDLKTQDIIKLAANNLLESVLSEVKNVALNEIQDEVFDVLNPDILNVLINQESGGFNALLDMLISGSLDKYDGEFNADELRDRVKDRIKETLDNNKDALKDNLKNEIDKIVRDLMENAGEKAEGIKTQVDEATGGVRNNQGSEEKKNPYTDDELAASLSDIPKDENGCRPGYEWQRMSGVGCVQKDCAVAGGHYSYTRDCICSFVDSKPEDKIKICKRPSNYSACPSCVYACVFSDSDCPER